MWKKGLNSILWIISIILIILGFINYFSGFLEPNKANVKDRGFLYTTPANGTMTITYMYEIGYKSKWVFIQNNPIKVSINVTKTQGTFQGNKYSAFFLGGENNCNQCLYPIEYNVHTGYCEKDIPLLLNEDKTNLIGHAEIVFSKYGDCNENIIVRQDDNPTQLVNLPTELQVSSIESWLTIKSNRYVISLTLILVGLAIIQSFLSLRKQSMKINS